MDNDIKTKKTSEEDDLLFEVLDEISSKKSKYKNYKKLHKKTHQLPFVWHFFGIFVLVLATFCYKIDLLSYDMTRNIFMFFLIGWLVVFGISESVSDNKDIAELIDEYEGSDEKYEDSNF